jgi:hypothetical protein
MQSVLVLAGLAIALIAIYRWVARKLSSPEIVVRLLLRRYHAFQKMGLSEQQSLFRILSSRRGWRNLPERFLAEIVARLKSKEDVMRFVSLAEGYRFNRDSLPDIAGDANIDAAMHRVTLWLADFGTRLQSESRLKEAEFVQKLALGLEPDRYFTTLPLATTYYKMARYEDALPLFENGFAQLESVPDSSTPSDYEPGDIAPGATVAELKAAHQPLYQACLNAAHPRRQQASGRRS